MEMCKQNANKVEKNVEQIMKKIAKIYIFKEKFAEAITKLLYVRHLMAFYCVSDGKKVEGACYQIMRWILCYVDLVNGFNPRTKERKGFITNYKTYGITIPKKHVNAYHSIIAKKIE
jgi:hypothetical protein